MNGDRFGSLERKKKSLHREYEPRSRPISLSNKSLDFSSSVAPGKDAIERIGIVDPKGSGQDWIIHHGWLLSRKKDK